MKDLKGMKDKDIIKYIKGKENIKGMKDMKNKDNMKNKETSTT